MRGEAALGLGRFLTARRAGRSRRRARPATSRTRCGRCTTTRAELVEVRGRALEALGVRGKEWVARPDRGGVRAAATAGCRSAPSTRWAAAPTSTWLPTIIDRDAQRRRRDALRGRDGGRRDRRRGGGAGTGGADRRRRRRGAGGGDHRARRRSAERGAKSVLQSLLSRERRRARAARPSTDALAAADFVDDPMAFKLYLDRSVADDDDERLAKRGRRVTTRYDDLRVEQAVSAGGVVYRRGEHGIEIVLCGRTRRAPVGAAEGHAGARRVAARRRRCAKCARRRGWASRSSPTSGRSSTNSRARPGRAVREDGAPLPDAARRQRRHRTSTTASTTASQWFPARRGAARDDVPQRGARSYGGRSTASIERDASRR